MKLNSFEELLVREVQELYDAEQHGAKILGKMIKAAHAPELRAALEEHLEATKTQIGRLEQAFQALDQPVKSETCKGIRGLGDESDEMVGEKGDPAVRDAGIILAAQKIEHYEIAAYGAVRTWAERLGHERMAVMIERSLQEEKDADKKLTELAESKINAEAQHHTAV